MIKKTLRNLVIGASVALSGIGTILNDFSYGEQMRNKRGRIIGSVDRIDIERAGVDPEFLPENIKKSEGYVYERWLDRNENKWPDYTFPNELIRSESENFNINGDIEFGAYLRNFQGHKLSFRLYDSNKKEIRNFFEVKVREPDIFYRIYEKDKEDVSKFIKDFGTGTFYFGFFIDDKCFKLRKFNVLNNPSEVMPKQDGITPWDITKIEGIRIGEHNNPSNPSKTITPKDITGSDEKKLK